MTKAQDNRDRIENNKRVAWFKKLRTLTGHIFTRLDANAANVAYAAGVAAETYAFELASREPVGKALFPMKAEAVSHAAEAARKTVAEVRQELIANGWDINACAPYPSSRVNMREWERATARAKYQLFHSVAKSDPAKGYQSSRENEPHYVIMNDEGISRYVEFAERGAAFQYDAFVIKLVTKIGEGATGATITGNHIWSYSVLTVTKSNGSTENWKTKQIVNVSKFGRDFYQWPSRLMK